MRSRISGLLVVLAMALAPAVGAQQSQEPVYEPGSGITVPKVIKEVKPYYTPDALRERVQGEVRLQCVVSKEGEPTQIEVTQPLDERLDQQAISALEQWRFAPGQKDGVAVAVRIAIEMTFTLR